MMQQLAVTPQLKRIMPLPSSPPTSTSMVIQMTLINPTGSLANRRQSSRLAMFHSRSTDPIDSSIPTNSIYLLATNSVSRVDTVLRVHKNNFVIFVRRILIYPVGIQNPQIGTFTTNTFFSSRTQRTLVLELIHTLIRLHFQGQSLPS
jgi:hypothetical protein